MKKVFFFDVKIFLKINIPVFQQNHARYEIIVMFFFNASVALIDIK